MFTSLAWAAVEPTTAPVATEPTTIAASHNGAIKTGLAAAGVGAAAAKTDRQRGCADGGDNFSHFRLQWFPTTTERRSPAICSRARFRAAGTREGYPPIGR